MFSHIVGTVTDVFPDRAVLEACGVGYELFCSGSTLHELKAGETKKLYTHFNISQDAVALYGFLSRDELAMFRKLISVTRVGPKLALSVLSVLTVSDITAAVLTDNASAFDRVSGMGKKTAARVLLELKEKVSGDDMLFDAGADKPAHEKLDMRAEATAALVSLGYDGVTAGRAVSKVTDADKVEDMITKALRVIARKD